MSETEYYNPGDLICECRLLAHVIYPKYRKEYCDYCFARNSKVKLCSKCLYVGYCNTKCQKSAWPDHRLECEEINASPMQLELTGMLILALRVSMKLKAYNGEIIEEIGSQKISFSDMPYFLGVAETCAHRILEGKASEEEIEKRLSILARVSFNLRTFYLDKECGIFFYLGMGLFQRSCLPNAIDLPTNKRTVQIRATKQIPKSDLKNVHLPNINLVTSFSALLLPPFRETHQHHMCYSCNSLRTTPVFSRNGISAEDTLSWAYYLFNQMFSCQGKGTPELREQVDMCLRDLKTIVDHTYIIRLRLLAWKVLTDHQDLFVVKHWERSLINLLKSVYGEQSFELYTVYTCLTEIYVKHKKYKSALIYKTKSDELGALYNKPPIFREEDFVQNLE